jgi:hypothetical protein
MADKKKKGRNPANQQSELFKALTRLFSGPIVNYRSQSGTKIRRQHLDKYSSRFRTASGQQFKKALSSPLDNIAYNAMQSQRRVERYVDFDQMEYMPEMLNVQMRKSKLYCKIFILKFLTWSTTFFLGHEQCASMEISFCT